MRLTEYIDYLNNGRKNVKRYTHYNPDIESKYMGTNKDCRRTEKTDVMVGKNIN